MLRVSLVCLAIAVCYASARGSAHRMERLLQLESTIFNADEDCKRLPPSLWCKSDALAKKCGYVDQCNSEGSDSRYKDYNKNKPILITLLYESLCPGCQQFITQQLYPRILKNFGPEFVKIELVPYGNAKMDAEGTITCQHGEEECSINKFESCIISALPNQTEHVSLIFCLEQQLKNKVEFDQATEKCFRTLAVTQDTKTLIQSCLVTTEVRRLQAAAAERTANVFPDKHDHVPWVLFNNASLAEAQVDMNEIPTMICDWWVGDKQIPYCEVEKVEKEKRRAEKEKVRGARCDL